METLGIYNRPAAYEAEPVDTFKTQAMLKGVS
jgi:hypothetical protein